MERRSEWKAKQGSLDSARLVFLDESGMNPGMTRLYGRATKHRRVIEAILDVRFQRMTILSSVRWDETTIPFVFEGAFHGEFFRAYVRDGWRPHSSRAIS
jgi:hypothetical protein